jgi:hypothetical protein
MTFRMEAGDKLNPANFEIVREPTGAPLSK